MVGPEIIHGLCSFHPPLAFAVPNLPYALQFDANYNLGGSRNCNPGVRGLLVKELDR